MRFIRARLALHATSLLLVVAAISASHAGGPELRALVESRVGRYVLEETTEGRGVLELVFGPEMSGRHTELLLDRLRGTARLREFSTELELRLGRIEERFRYNRERPLLDGGRIRRLTAADESLLSELAAEELAIEAGGYGSRARIRFAEPPADTTYLRTRASFEGPPLADAFPADAWEGRLSERVARLVRRWPRNVRLVEGVRFRFPAAEYGEAERTGSRTVVVIVKGSLSEEAWKRLSADYVRAVSRGSVSFPIGSSPGHLYTRIGGRSYDFMGSVDMSAYYSSEGGRLEPLVSLTAAEESRLRQYVRNAIERPERVLGSFDSGEGAASGVTGGRLGSNRPRRGEEHNCTSWMACAPIGTEGASLFEIVGARATDVVHTNPGWWTVFLSAAPRARRVPFVVYWGEESTLSGALGRVRSGEVLEWNFNPQ